MFTNSTVTTATSSTGSASATPAAKFDFHQMVAASVVTVNDFGIHQPIKVGDLVVADVKSTTPVVFDLTKIVRFDASGATEKADGWGLNLYNPTSKHYAMLTPYSPLPVVHEDSTTVVFHTPVMEGLARDKLSFEDKGDRIIMTMEQEIPHRTVVIEMIKVKAGA